jgi:pimeloyl-ACP methyl ester carboxylesterase
MTREIHWQSNGVIVTLGMDEAGSGSTLVLLPALSSISTRGEMRPLFERLAPTFRVVTVDWPGFGDLARPRSDWTPDTLSAFLNWFLNEISGRAHAIVAAGHAATYVLHQAARRPETIDRLVLIAPTWRGPLPTMVGSYRPWLARIRKAVDMPGIGPLLYRLNVNRLVVTKMAREHVYSDRDWLVGDRLASKLAVTRAPGARHASVRFVTGGLDRVETQEAFLDVVQKGNKPILVIYGEESPPKSRAEIEALADLPNVRIERLPKGKLAIHEEFAEAIAPIVQSFLVT